MLGIKREGERRGKIGIIGWAIEAAGESPPACFFDSDRKRYRPIERGDPDLTLSVPPARS